MAELAIEKKFLTDVGRKRRHNEDFVDFYEPHDPEELARSGRLYIVADGVGGGAAGEIASEYAVGRVLHEYYRSTEPDLGERLRAAIHAANAGIFEHVEQRPELGRMGTTIVVAVVLGDQLTVANVGDSRAYLIRNGEIRQITRDHSLVAKLVNEGSITPEEAEYHPKRNVVLRSIGADPDVYPDIFEGQLRPGDQIVLCSDGLTRYVSDNEIMSVAERTRVDRAVEQLVEMANVRGGKDNISVMILRVTELMSRSALVEKLAESRALVRPEFDSIHETVHKRRKVPTHKPRSPVPARPTWVWLAFGGVIAALVLSIAAFIAGRALGFIPAFTSPMATPSTTISLSDTEAIPTLLYPSATSMPTVVPARTDVPVPTFSPTESPAPTPTSPSLPVLGGVATRPTDARGDVRDYNTDIPVSQPLAGLDIQSAGVAPNPLVELESVPETPSELRDWASSEELLLWIALHDSIPISPTASAQWLFALDVDGNIDSGRPPYEAKIDPDLGDEAIVGLRYNSDTGTYIPYFWVWDLNKADWDRRPEVPSYGFFRDRTLIGLALPLETFTQTVEQVTPVTVVPGALRWRAAAVSYVQNMVDFYPDLPSE